MMQWKLGSVDLADYRPNGKGKGEEGRWNKLTEHDLLVLVRVSYLVCSLV